MSELLELAERCEKATGPDRHLNLAIANAIYGDDLAPPGTSYAFTSSLDAAMTLVPEGQEWAGGFEDGAAFAHVHVPGEYAELIEAATPALALCAAALRARAASVEEKGK